MQYLKNNKITYKAAALSNLVVCSSTSSTWGWVKIAIPMVNLLFSPLLMPLKCQFPSLLCSLSCRPNSANMLVRTLSNDLQSYQKELLNDMQSVNRVSLTIISYFLIVVFCYCACWLWLAWRKGLSSLCLVFKLLVNMIFFLVFWGLSFRRIKKTFTFNCFWIRDIVASMGLK